MFSVSASQVEDSSVGFQFFGGEGGKQWQSKEIYTKLPPPPPQQLHIKSTFIDQYAQDVDIKICLKWCLKVDLHTNRKEILKSDVWKECVVCQIRGDL